MQTLRVPLSDDVVAYYGKPAAEKAEVALLLIEDLKQELLRNLHGRIDSPAILSLVERIGFLMTRLDGPPESWRSLSVETIRSLFWLPDEELVEFMADMQRPPERRKKEEDDNIPPPSSGHWLADLHAQLTLQCQFNALAAEQLLRQYPVDFLQCWSYQLAELVKPKEERKADYHEDILYDEIEYAEEFDFDYHQALIGLGPKPERIDDE